MHCSKLELFVALVASIALRWQELESVFALALN